MASIFQPKGNVDEERNSSLHYACVGRSKEAVQYLVEDLKCDVGEHATIACCLQSEFVAA